MAISLQLRQIAIFESPTNIPRTRISLSIDSHRLYFSSSLDAPVEFVIITRGRRSTMSTRRDFVKMAAGMSLAPAVLRASQVLNAMPAKTAGFAAKVYLEPFD